MVVNNPDTIKNFILENNICVVTNSWCAPGSTFLASIKSYINYVPIHNFWIVPGYMQKTHSIEQKEPYYGERAFFHIVMNIMIEQYPFDWIIYIDDDCFIKDFGLLIEEFKKFQTSGCCLAGVQDGTVMCHRNHSLILVNTFLSFWNIKEIKLKMRAFLETRNDLLEHHDEIFTYFKKIVNPELLKQMQENAEKSTAAITEYRKQNYKVDVPYSEIVKDDPNNPIEPHQVPYSTDDETAVKNAEPYYLIEEVMVHITGMPIYYLFGTDYYNPDPDNDIDNSGLTSVVLTSDEKHDIIAYHTWFSRLYTKWPKSQRVLDNTKRINTVIKNI